MIDIAIPPSQQPAWNLWNAEAAERGEVQLLHPLLRWLRHTRRINEDTRVAVELSWFGRRVDLATLTRTGRAVAYELKLGGLRRALEQASYNRLAFDRSYVVTGCVPRARNVALAAEYGIGLIVVRADEVSHLLDSPMRRAAPELRDRLLRHMRLAGSIPHV